MLIILCMSLPFLVFWMLALLARSQLGWRGAFITIGIWAAMLSGFMYLNVSQYYFVAAQCLLDCILILIVFKGDIRIN